MATTEERLEAAHRALKRASKRIAAQQQEIEALRRDVNGFEALVNRSLKGFEALVKEQSRSIQKAAQGNFRSLDERISKLEAAKKRTTRTKTKEKQPEQKTETK